MNSRLILLALERLHDLSQDPDAFPTVPDITVRIFKTLAKSGATEAAPILSADLFSLAGIRGELRVGTSISYTASLLHTYAPGILISRRRIKGRHYGYWITVGDPTPSAEEQLAVNEALAESAWQNCRNRITPVAA